VEVVWKIRRQSALPSGRRNRQIVTLTKELQRPVLRARTQAAFARLLMNSMSAIRSEPAALSNSQRDKPLATGHHKKK
jgi:hypothetical protein